MPYACQYDHLCACCKAHTTLQHLQCELAYVCRVKFDTQNAVAGDDIPLVKAAKAFWANAKPTFWHLCAFVAPPVAMPLLRVLVRGFPSQVLVDLEEAHATLYDASDCLIKVLTDTPVLCRIESDNQLSCCPLAGYSQWYPVQCQQCKAVTFPVDVLWAGGAGGWGWAG